jgi:hypothetical protein
MRDLTMPAGSVDITYRLTDGLDPTRYVRPSINSQPTNAAGMTDSSLDVRWSHARSPATQPWALTSKHIPFLARSSSYATSICVNVRDRRSDSRALTQRSGMAFPGLAVGEIGERISDGVRPAGKRNVTQQCQSRQSEAQITRIC